MWVVVEGLQVRDAYALMGAAARRRRGLECDIISHVRLASRCMPCYVRWMDAAMRGAVCATSIINGRGRMIGLVGLGKGHGRVRCLTHYGCS